MMRRSSRVSDLSQSRTGSLPVAERKKATVRIGPMPFISENAERSELHDLPSRRALLRGEAGADGFARFFGSNDGGLFRGSDAVREVAELLAQRAAELAVQRGPVGRVGTARARLVHDHEIRMRLVDRDRAFGADDFEALVDLERRRVRQAPYGLENARRAVLEPIHHLAEVRVCVLANLH